MSGGIWIAVSVLLGMLIMEMYYPDRLMEGFQGAPFFRQKGISTIPRDPASEMKPNVLLAKFEMRGDIGPHKEEGGYK